MKCQLNDSRIIEINDDVGTISDFPAYIEVQTASYCNSRCIICPYPKIKSFIPMGKMKRLLWDKLLGEFEINRAKIKNIEPYLNNEPFLDKDMLDLLYTLKPLGRYVEVSTNLQNCSYELMDEIIKNRLIDELRCSIFGLSPESYKSIMGIDMNNVLEKLNYVALANKNAGSHLKIQLTMVLHDSFVSCDELYKAKDLADELGVCFKAYPYLDRAENNDFLTTKIISTKNKKVLGCKLGYIKDRLAIWHDGIVALCCQDWQRQHVIGDLNKTSIRDLWHSPEMQNYRDSIYSGCEGISDLLCKKCALSIVEVIQ